MSRWEDIVVTNIDAQLHFKHLAGQYFSVNCRLSKNDKTKTDFFYRRYCRLRGIFLGC